MLYWYYGADAFRLHNAVTDLVRSLRTQHGTGLRVARVDCTSADASDEIERHLKYPSFFGDRTCLVVTDAAGNVLGDLLTRYDFGTLEDIILIAVQDTSAKSAEKSVMAALADRADTTATFMPLKAAEMVPWVNDMCSTLGGTIEPDASRELVRRIGSDSGRCAMELAKLIAYATPGPVDIGAIRLLTPEPPERDEWELSNAIASVDKRAIMTALWKRVQEGTPEQLLIGSCAAGLRNLLMISELRAQKRTPAGIAKLTGIHPFVVTKTLRGAGSADAGRLRTAHLALAHLDRDAKNGLSDATDGMFALLLSL